MKKKFGECTLLNEDFAKIKKSKKSLNAHGEGGYKKNELKFIKYLYNFKPPIQGH
jgi:hypothetical protein